MKIGLFVLLVLLFLATFDLGKTSRSSPVFTPVGFILRSSVLTVRLVGVR